MHGSWASGSRASSSSSSSRRALRHTVLCRSQSWWTPICCTSFSRRDISKPEIRFRTGRKGSAYCQALCRGFRGSKRRMVHYYAFNGDADGLCALHQLRLVEMRPATLVTGVKRDITLLKHIPGVDGDSVTVLDVSLQQNRKDLLRLLDSRVSVRYFDHHQSGEIPGDPLLEVHIDESADVCTSVLVDRYIEGRHRLWAIVAAFGDNLTNTARAMASEAGLDPKATAALEKLGTCLNYNAYGETIEDLHYHPAELSELMMRYGSGELYRANR